jgi:hypothetical protein
MKRVIVVLGVLLASFGFVGVVHAELEPWEIGSGGNGNWYGVVSYPEMTWDEAAVDIAETFEDECYLATITSQEENDFVVSLLPSDPTDRDHYWLGGSDRDDEGVWEWVNDEGVFWENGDEIQYNNWWTYEPNDQAGIEEHVALDYRIDFELGGWKWNDIGQPHHVVKYVKGYVVECSGTGAGPEYASVDIKPGSCPNPLNTNSGGVLPVAILGTADFDVTAIDRASISLEGVAPIRSKIEDVGTPVVEPDPCECTTDKADGFDDLTLKFDRQDIIYALGDVNDRDELELILTATLSDGTVIEGYDCVIILK